MPHVALVRKGVPSAMAVLVDDYLAHLKSKRVASSTIQWHEWCLEGMLLTFCADHEVAKPAQLTTRLLERLQAPQLAQPNMHTGKPRSPATVRTYMRSVRDFLSWARKEGEQVPASAAEIRVPKQPRVKLLRDQIRKLEDGAKTERDKLIIRILADTGMRLDELCRLNLDDLVDENHQRFLSVRHRHYGGGAKGQSARPVPIPRLWPRLKQYIKAGRPKDADSQRIFLSLARSPRTGKHE